MSKRFRKAVETPASRPPRTKRGASGEDQIEILVNGVSVEVSSELEAAVHRAYKGLCQPLPAEMTTSRAAEFLDVSRPFVIKLIEQGELPCRMVGTHRRIPSAALAEYKEKMFRRAKKAADEMTRMAQELGLYKLEGQPPKGK